MSPIYLNLFVVSFNFIRMLITYYRNLRYHAPWILLPILPLLSLTYTQSAKGVNVLAEGKVATEENPELIKVLEVDCIRSFLRGPIDQAFEMFNRTTKQPAMARSSQH
jgi:hypothetical protein